MSIFFRLARAGGRNHILLASCDEGPRSACRCGLSPGGYPELHAEHSPLLEFRGPCTRPWGRGAHFGECGGYMVLGDGLVAGGWRALRDARAFAARHELCRTQAASRLPARDTGRRRVFLRRMTAHEFHYATSSEGRRLSALHGTGRAGLDLAPPALSPECCRLLHASHRFLGLIMAAPIIHGGGQSRKPQRASAARRRLARSLDGYQPVPRPPAENRRARLAPIPDQHVEEAARARPRGYYRTGELMPLPVPGTQAVIQLLPRIAVQGKRVAGICGRLW